MEASGSACPTCGGSDTQPVELVWESRHGESRKADLAQRVAPPAPRAAATNAGWFYLSGFLGLVAWILAMVYVASLVAFRSAAVFFVVVVAVGVGVLQLVRLFTGGPKPTDDQIAALDEWKAAHREWQRKRVCLRCGATFIPWADEA